MKILTDYRIIKEQCPLWEENTIHIDDIPYWGSGFAFNGHHLVKTLRLFLHRKGYDLVVTGDFRGSQAYAFLQWFFPWGRRPQLMLDFMLDEEKPGPVWKIKRALQKRILARVDKILIFSREELEDYVTTLSIPREKFHFLYYHTNIIRPRPVRENEGYIFAAGNAGRDYETFLKALEGSDMPAVIVTSPQRMEGLKVPPAVKVYYNIPYSRYLGLLEKAQIVVVPLHKRVRSVGMVVAMEGMALGKPVIATRGRSLVEYIRDGENGCLVDVGDSAALRERIDYLRHNPQKAREMGRRALEDTIKNWTFEDYVTNVLKIARSMAGEK